MAGSPAAVLSRPNRASTTPVAALNSFLACNRSLRSAIAFRTTGSRTLKPVQPNGTIKSKQTSTNCFEPAWRVERYASPLRARRLPSREEVGHEPIPINSIRRRARRPRGQSLARRKSHGA